MQDRQKDARSIFIKFRIIRLISEKPVTCSSFQMMLFLILIQNSRGQHNLSMQLLVTSVLREAPLYFPVYHPLFPSSIPNNKAEVYIFTLQSSLFSNKCHRQLTKQYIKLRCEVVSVKKYWCSKDSQQPSKYKNIFVICIKYKNLILLNSKNKL